MRLEARPTDVDDPIAWRDRGLLDHQRGYRTELLGSGFVMAETPVHAHRASMDGPRRFAR